MPGDSTVLPNVWSVKFAAKRGDNPVVLLNTNVFVLNPSGGVGALA
jgi:hypothetical protein